MKLTHSDLRTLYRSGTGMPARRDCPSGETLARAAAGQLSHDERDLMADHIAVCAECADEYRLTTPVKAWAREAGLEQARSRYVLPYAAAAAIGFVALSLGGWSWLELRSTRRTLDEATARATQYEREATTLRAANDQLAAPVLNAPILDLAPRDATRGHDATATNREQRLMVPAHASAFTLILTTTNNATRYDVEISDAAGTAIWAGRGLERGRDGSLTLLLPRKLVPSGSYRVRLKAPDSAQIAEEYRVRVEYQ
jgi:hypothetical protein